MLHVYIDTNVLLRFYSYSDDTLLEIEKLAALIKSGQVHSYTTQQTIDEYSRNRDSEVAEALKRLDSFATTVELPRFTYVFEEAAALTNALKDAKNAKAALMAKVRETLASGNLKADHLIEEIFQGSEVLIRDEALIAKAELRAKVGNPPGKGLGIGDQINWEALLRDVPKGAELHIISRDGDYSAKDDRSRLSHFLLREWREAKEADAILYNGLGAFTKKHFPEIKVPTDAVKLEALRKLIESGNFANTHKQIARLETVFDEINVAEALSLLQAIVDNSQIRGIATDEDVQSFFSKLYSKFYGKTSTDLDDALDEVGPYFLPF